MTMWCFNSPTVKQPLLPSWDSGYTLTCLIEFPGSAPLLSSTLFFLPYLITSSSQSFWNHRDVPPVKLDKIGILFPAIPHSYVLWLTLPVVKYRISDLAKTQKYYWIATPIVLIWLSQCVAVLLSYSLSHSRSSKKPGYSHLFCPFTAAHGSQLGVKQLKVAKVKWRKLKWKKEKLMFWK